MANHPRRDTASPVGEAGAGGWEPRSNESSLANDLSILHVYYAVGEPGRLG